MTEEKALGILRLKLNRILSPFRLHGLDVYVPGAAEEIIKTVAELKLLTKQEVGNCGEMSTKLGISLNN